MTSLSNSKHLPAISREDEQALHAYVDGEFGGAEGRALESRLSSEPALRAHLEEIRATSRWFMVDAEREMRDLPQARFEQLWDELDSRLAKDASAGGARSRPHAVAASAENEGSWALWWARLRLPAGAVAVAAAAVVVFTVVTPTGPVTGPVAPGDSSGGVASTDPSPRPSHAPRVAGDADPTPPSPEFDPALRIADASPGVAAAPQPGTELPSPDSNDADIERIEFGGASGQISRIEGVRGTTTVIWVEEDDQPADTERSL